MQRRRLIFGGLMALPLAFGAAMEAQAVTYSVTDVGALPAPQGQPSQSYATAINAKGDIIGSTLAYTPAGPGWQGFLWQSGQFEPIGPIPNGGGPFGAAGESYPYGLNDAGNVVGGTYIANPTDGLILEEPFLYVPPTVNGGTGTFTVLPTFNPLGSDSNTGIAYGINDSNLIVGQANPSGNAFGVVPARFALSGATLLPAPTDPPGYLAYQASMAGAYFASNNGLICGYGQAFNDDGGFLDGYLGFHGSVIRNGAVQLLGALGNGNQYVNFATTDFAVMINDAGQTVGYDQALTSDGLDEGSRAVLWAGGATIDLGTLGTQTATDPNTGATYQTGYSAAAGLNMSDQVVGQSFAYDKTGAPLGNHGFIYQNGTLSDLNTMLQPGTNWVVTAASGINDAGQIAATATDSAGNTHAVLLTPVLSANEGALYPRIMATGRASKLILQVGKASLMARAVSVRSSSTAIKVPSRIILPAGSKRVVIPVEAAASLHAELATLDIDMGTVKMRAGVRAVPMK